MRRTALALAAAAALVAAGGAEPAAAGEPIECTEYCGAQAAGHCDDIDSWSCTWYILGCLAGCNLD